MPPRRTPLPDSTQAEMTIGSKLCTQCGLCCTGALHDYASLVPGETSFAAGLGLKVTEGEKPSFALPCPRLVGCACSIYPTRPQVCGKYKCQLLLDVEGGLTDLAEAMDKVRHAKNLVEEVEKLLPPGTTLPQARKQFLRENGQSQAGPDFMAVRLALTVLCLYL